MSESPEPLPGTVEDRNEEGMETEPLTSTVEDSDENGDVLEPLTSIVEDCEENGDVLEPLISTVEDYDEHGDILEPITSIKEECDENGEGSPSPPESPTEKFCTLCGNVASSDGSLPDGSTVASKLSVWQSLGHVSDRREVPEGAPLCQSCVDLVVSTQELDDQMDDNLELVSGLLRAADDDNDVIFDAIFEEGEFDSNWRKNLIATPLTSQHRQSVLFPKSKKYLKWSRFKVCFGQQNKGPPEDHDQCAVCKDVSRAAANACTWHFSSSGKLVVDKIQLWCKARPSEPCRPFKRPIVPLCQLCVDMLLDTDDIERKILENLVVLSQLVKENPKMNHVSVGTEAPEDIDIKPDVLPSILVQAQMAGENGDVVDVKPDLDAIRERLEEFQPDLGNVKHEGLSALIPESGSDPLAETSAPSFTWVPEEVKPVVTRSGRTVRRSAAASQPVYEAFLAQILDSDDSDVEEVYASVKQGTADGENGQGRPKKSKPIVKEDDDWNISEEEPEEVEDVDDLEDSDDDEDEFEDEGEEDGILREVNGLKKRELAEPTMKDRIAGAEIWFSWKCRVCDLEHDDEIVLTRHFDEAHAGLSPFVCHFCLLEFKKSEHYAQHVMIEELRKEAEGEFKCKHCSEGFPNPRFLSVHCGENHGAEDRDGGPFTCKECSKSFPSFTHFVEHRQKPLEEHTVAAPKHRAEFTCDLCGCQLETEEGYADHLKAMHSGTSKVFECPRCNSCFQTVKLLEKHLLTNEFNPKKECEFCCLIFPTVTECTKHMRSRHPAGPKQGPAEKTTVCPYCGIDSSRMKEHISRVHKKEARIKCKICGERFIYSNAYNRHLALAHNKNLESIQQPCPECGKILRGRKMMIKHLLGVHNIETKGVKFYPCSYCDRKFIDLRTLKEHTYSHEGVKPHACPTCDHKTVTFINLKTHMKWKHRRLVSRKFRDDAMHGDDLAYEIVDKGPWIREEKEKGVRRGKKADGEDGEPKKKRKRVMPVKVFEEEEKEDAPSMEDGEGPPKKKRRSRKKADNTESAPKKRKSAAKKSHKKVVVDEDSEEDEEASWAENGGEGDEEPKKRAPRSSRASKKTSYVNDDDLGDLDTWADGLS